MKKVMSFLSSFALFIGGAIGVCLVELSFLDAAVYAASFTESTTTINGSKIEKMVCTLGEDDLVTITYDGGKTKKFHYAYSNCKTSLNHLYDELKSAGFQMQFEKSKIGGDASYASTDGSSSSNKVININGHELQGTSIKEITCMSEGDTGKYRFSVKTGEGAGYSYTFETASECNTMIDKVRSDAISAGFGTSGLTISRATSNDGDLSRPGNETLHGNIINCEDYDDEEGGGVICIAKIALNIMTYGVGILGVVGIVISGIQYITSQGDPGKMAKAKNRIIEVVIGLVLYAVMYAALYFLVPGFNTDALGVLPFLFR